MLVVLSLYIQWLRAGTQMNCDKTWKDPSWTYIFFRQQMSRIILWIFKSVNIVSFATKQDKRFKFMVQIRCSHLSGLKVGSLKKWSKPNFKIPVRCIDRRRLNKFPRLKNSTEAMLCNMCQISWWICLLMLLWNSQTSTCNSQNIVLGLFPPKMTENDCCL